MDSIFNFYAFAQLIGVIGMLILVLGLYQKNDKTSAKIVIISLFFWALHFSLLGVYSAAAASIIGIIRTVLSFKYKKNFKIFLGIIIALIVLSYITYISYISLLPLLASFLGAYGYFYLEGLQKRILMLGCSLLWLFHNVFVVSIAGIYNEFLVIITLGISIIQMGGLKTHKFHFKDKILNIFHFHHHDRPDLGRFNIFTHKELINKKK